MDTVDFLDKKLLDQDSDSVSLSESSDEDDDDDSWGGEGDDDDDDDEEDEEVLEYMHYTLNPYPLCIPRTMTKLLRRSLAKQRVPLRG